MTNRIRLAHPRPLASLAGLLVWSAVAIGCMSVVGGGTGISALAETVRISPVYRVNGKSLVGGPFKLTNHRGEQVTHEDFRGKYMLAYFGYTHCPDICPHELQVITEALDRLGDKAAEVQPVFITVDPERDTVDHMAKYVSHFHPKLIGLTGTEEEILVAAKAYRVLFRKAYDPSSSDYLVDHSSVTFLMDEEGEYAAHFVLGTTVDEMVEILSKQLGK